MKVESFFICLNALIWEQNSEDQWRMFQNRGIFPIWEFSVKFRKNHLIFKITERNDLFVVISRLRLVGLKLSLSKTNLSKLFKFNGFENLYSQVISYYR